MKKANKKTTDNKLTTKQYIEKFEKALKNVNSSIYTVGKIYSDALLNDPKAGAEFAKHYPNVSPNRWEILRLIGRGDVKPSIWATSDKVAMAILRLKPLDREFLLSCDKDGVDVVGVRSGRVKKLRLGELSQITLPILMDSKTGKIRSTDEQREFLKMRMSQRNRENAANLPYLMSDGCIEVLRKCKLMRSEIRDMIIHLCGNVKSAVAYVKSGK